MSDGKEFTIGITCYQKVDAEDILLQSLFDFGYHKLANIHLADDNCGAEYLLKKSENPGHPIWETTNKEEVVMPSTKTLAEKYKIPLSYGTWPKQGISCNKNRNIKYFKENPTNYLYLIDDDQQVIKEGLLEELASVLASNRLEHVTSMWSDKPGTEKRQETGNTWYQDFPVQAMGDRITWHQMGCHGSGNFYTKKCIDVIGYYNTEGFYGYGGEHTVHSARAMRFCGRTPIWLPQHTRTYKYMVGQSVPNNYSGAWERWKKSEPKFNECMAALFEGKGVVIRESGLNDKEEICIK